MTTYVVSPTGQVTVVGPGISPTRVGSPGEFGKSVEEVAKSVKTGKLPTPSQPSQAKTLSPPSPGRGAFAGTEARGKFQQVRKFEDSKEVSSFLKFKPKIESPDVSTQQVRPPKETKGLREQAIEKIREYEERATGYLTGQLLRPLSKTEIGRKIKARKEEVSRLEREQERIAQDRTTLESASRKPLTPEQADTLSRRIERYNEEVRKFNEKVQSKELEPGAVESSIQAVGGFVPFLGRLATEVPIAATKPQLKVDSGRVSVEAPLVTDFARELTRGINQDIKALQTQLEPLPREISKDFQKLSSAPDDFNVAESEALQDIKETGKILAPYGAIALVSHGVGAGARGLRRARRTPKISEEIKRLEKIESIDAFSLSRQLMEDVRATPKIASFEIRGVSTAKLKEGGREPVIGSRGIFDVGLEPIKKITYEPIEGVRVTKDITPTFFSKGRIKAGLPGKKIRVFDIRTLSRDLGNELTTSLSEIVPQDVSISPKTVSAIEKPILTGKRGEKLIFGTGIMKLANEVPKEIRVKTRGISANIPMTEPVGAPDFFGEAPTQTKFKSPTVKSLNKIMQQITKDVIEAEVKSLKDIEKSIKQTPISRSRAERIAPVSGIDFSPLKETQLIEFEEIVEPMAIKKFSAPSISAITSTELRSALKSQTKSLMKQDQKTRNLLGLKPMVRTAQREVQRERFGTMVSPRTLAKQQEKELTRTLLRTRIPKLPRQPTIPEIPSFKPIPILFPLVPKRKPREKKKKKKAKPILGRAYSPSLTAKAFGIEQFVTRKGIEKILKTSFTGLETRPILTTKKRR